MAYIFDDRLVEIKKNLARKKHLERVLKDLLAQMENEKSNLRVASFALEREEGDVEKYEDSFLYRLLSIIGKGDERLEKEKREAADALLRQEAARVKYEDACREVERVQEEYLSITETDEDLRRMLEIKKKYVVSYGDEVASKIIEAENAITDIETSRLPEIREAITFGNKAKETGNRLSWVLSDMSMDSIVEIIGIFLGSGPSAHRSPFYEMKKAGRLAREFQVSLSAFRAELRDVKMSGKVGGFEEIPDVYYRVFSELIQGKNASKAQKEVEELYGRITDILMVLDKEKEYLIGEAARLKSELEEMIISSKLKGE
ncbi:MAG: hypothetical protein IKM61_00955 [Eubacteriaceae bacterium]|nr:hypothetical protein [Eubacteriaceae bacterium]